MKPLTKAIAVALIQVLIVCSLGAKLLYDRHTRPQAWFLAERYDPNLPIRGRYLALRLDVTDSRTPQELEQKFGADRDYQMKTFHHVWYFGQECGSIVMRDGKPVAQFDSGRFGDCRNLSFERWPRGDQSVLQLREPVLFFIPDTSREFWMLKPGEEMWVLATIPGKGPPRPIRVGIKKAGDATITPLDVN
ncbi:MAG TPA: hypothetical protein VKV39_00190 [Candidatus Sulfotelmatobacter sp.]|nr:hypothetical protein [Candidatus Sulfotelmatobacter sp.]